MDDALGGCEKERLTQKKERKEEKATESERENQSEKRRERKQQQQKNEISKFGQLGMLLTSENQQKQKLKTQLASAFRSIFAADITIFTLSRLNLTANVRNGKISKVFKGFQPINTIQRFMPVSNILSSNFLFYHCKLFEEIQSSNFS